jgi:hypothetical protein
MDVPLQTWYEVSVWASQNEQLTYIQRNIAMTLSKYAASGRRPSIKQAVQGLKILTEAREFGFEEGTVAATQGSASETKSGIALARDSRQEPLSSGILLHPDHEGPVVAVGIESLDPVQIRHYPRCRDRGSHGLAESPLACWRIGIRASESR